MPLRLIYGSLFDQNVNYHLNNGSVIDGWSLINIRLNTLVADSPFEIVYYGDQSNRSWALVYENLAQSDSIDMHLEADNFKLRIDLLQEYKQLLQSAGLNYVEFKPQLLVLVC